MERGGMHGWVWAPGGRIVARFTATNPSVDCGSFDVLVLADTRAEAVRRAKRVGLHRINLRTNPRPPTEPEVRSLLESGEDILWRPFGEDVAWRSGASLPTRRY